MLPYKFSPIITSTLCRGDEVSDEVGEDILDHGADEAVGVAQVKESPSVHGLKTRVHTLPWI